MNSFGRNFRIAIFGESHGEALGVVVDGVRAGIALSTTDFDADLARRRGGGGPGTTPRREEDAPEIVSGLFEGHTTGAPLTVMFRNGNTRSGDYAHLAAHPRPSHADFVAAQKFGGWNDPRGGGHFSGRVTLGLVAAGVVARKMLPHTVALSSEITEIGGVRDSAEFEATIAAAVRDGDSVGGVVECRASGVPVGVGEPFFDSVESVAAHLMLAIPGVKGVEFGSGFAGARRRGSENNDPLVDASGTTATNHAGGIVGGIANGNELVVRVAVTPTASIGREQHTYNMERGSMEPLTIGGRHDACIALRAAVVVEAALAIALADLCALVARNS
jgi:chorismate synthase